MRTFDIAIIGAGPAGMAAAVEADRAGLSAVVLDEQPAPGGQIYRAMEAADAARLDILGEDYAAGRALVDAFRASGAVFLPGATVWNVDAGKTIDYSTARGSEQVAARALIVASGAVERPVPLPGWTLPGVTTAGALQILLKAHGAVDDDVVLAGCGPLVYLVAHQMLRAGVKPRAIIETTDAGRTIAALKHLPRALLAWPYLRKGMSMRRDIRRSGVPFYGNAGAVRIEGETAVRAISFDHRGKRHRIETTAVALHQGVVPNQQITRLLRCQHEWNAGQRCFVPKLDASGETTVENVFVAGDGAGIAGAVSAALRGRIAALRIAEKAGRGDPARYRMLSRLIEKDRAIRPLLETLYAPSAQVLSPEDETIVCRCEEITAGQIRKSVALGAQGPNQVKSFLRCGMGPCQGRVCGLAVTEIIAEKRDVEPSVIDYYRIRPPLKPLLLSELAAVEETPE